LPRDKHWCGDRETIEQNAVPEKAILEALQLKAVKTFQVVRRRKEFVKKMAMRRYAKSEGCSFENDAASMPACASA
jgi:hypothetical protein